MAKTETRGSRTAQSKKSAVRIINESIESVSVSDLKLHPRNVNQGDVGAIHESIRHNGFWGTIVAQRSTGYVLAGNHRLIAAKEAGATEVPVAWVDVSDEEALRILLADNRTTRLGHDDPQELADLLQELVTDTGTLEGTGFDGDDLDELLADLGLGGGNGRLTPVSVQPLPSMTWVLIGIPTVRFGEIAEQIERFSRLDGVEVHLTANSDAAEPEDG